MIGLDVQTQMYGVRASAYLRVEFEVEEAFFLLASFTDAAIPEIARPLVEYFAELMNAQGVPTQKGEFGAHMLVEIENDGPLTIWMERI